MGHLTAHPMSLGELPGTLTTISLSALRNAAALLGVYLLTLALYRLFFHPLANYPGPFWAKITDWYSVYHAYRGDRHLALYHAHAKYGPTVRIAPNSLSFNTSTSLKTIYGHTAAARAVQKASFYSAFPAVKGVHNTHNAISKLEHGRKRRVLSAAFSDTALKTMEPLVLENVETLLNTLPEEQAENMGEKFSWFTFDVMGALCFGKSFDMLTAPGSRFVTMLIDQAAHMHYIAGNYLPIKTLGIARFLFPNIAANRWKFILLSRECANQRMKAGHTAKKDFFYYLLHAKDPETGQGFSTAELWGEANVLMIAGSDTTATALSATMYYLTRNPEKLRKLREEIRGRFGSLEEIITGPQLGGCEYLKACLDEAMRLAPPVPGMLPREVVAEEGVTVDGVHVPCGTVIGTPIYTLHHNEQYFPQPFEFVPERWLEHKEETSVEGKESPRDAFTPFSIGARGCIGKSVAYMEMRLMVGRLAWGWEWEEVRSQELVGKGWKVKEGEFELRDHFTSRKYGPMLKFTKREGI